MLRLQRISPRSTPSLPPPADITSVTLSPRPTPTSVLVVDDHAGFRGALERLLARTDDLRVVGAACDGAQAVELVARLRPDVVVMDLAMPVLSGVAAIRRIRGETDPPAVVALSGSRALWREARAAGVSCTLLKDADPEQLVATIRAAARA